MGRPYIVAIEGVDGCGKSTVIDQLREHFHDAMFAHFPTRSTAPGRLIHDYLTGNDVVQGEDLLELFLLDMYSFLSLYVYPVGGVWIFDRYIHSTLVYQPVLSGLGRDRIRDLASSLGVCFPDIAIYLRVDISTALERLSSRTNINRLDKDPRVLESVISGYDELSRAGYLVTVDATQPVDKVVSACVDIVRKGVING